MTSGQASTTDRDEMDGTTTGATFGVKVAPVNDEDREADEAVKSELVSATDTFVWVDTASRPSVAVSHHVLTLGSTPRNGVALTASDA